eukprot:TRINITY_DN2120_c0_g1_i1.p1 TRINITY_DN2120_c0_g1~~TRINITY_DN2120_c0_g1_i1.p1  ORF type:complete len:384 (+),score=132.19 TRINITY_DN2120_c0_g1_i1:82-1233(+)
MELDDAAAAESLAAEAAEGAVAAAAQQLGGAFDTIEQGAAAFRKAVADARQQAADALRAARAELTARERALAAERAALDETLARLQRCSGTGDRRVLLNVGGSRFETTRQTLCAEQSFLSALVDFGARSAAADGAGESAPPAADEELFIDRNPRPFPVILDFLRSGRFDGDGLSRRELAELRQEADYYQLRRLLRALGEMQPPFVWEIPPGRSIATEGQICDDGLSFTSEARGKWDTALGSTVKTLGGVLEWSVCFARGNRIIIGVVDQSYREGDISPYWAYENDGALYHNNECDFVHVACYEPGDIITIFADTGERVVSFARNGVVVHRTQRGNGPAVAVPAVSLKAGSVATLVGSRAAAERFAERYPADGSPPADARPAAE